MIDFIEHHLLVINEKQSLKIPFTQQVTIGRDVINALALQDKEISRSHAIIYGVEENGEAPRLAVKDLDSLNGVYVNGKKVAKSRLRQGDELVMGQTIILLSPDNDADLEACLSEKGKRVLKRIKSVKPIKPTPITAFTLSELEELAAREINNLENSAIWSPKNAAVMIDTVTRMAEIDSEAEFFKAVLEAALQLAHADRGVIMIQEPGSKTMGIRSIHSDQAGQTIVISHNVMRVLMKGGKAFFSPDVAEDDRLPDFAENPKPSDPHSLVAVPIKRHKKPPSGFLYLDSHNRNFSYDRWTLILLSLLLRPCVHIGYMKGFIPTKK